jgi:hypothetical protein
MKDTCDRSTIDKSSDGGEKGGNDEVNGSDCEIGS